MKRAHTLGTGWKVLLVAFLATTLASSMVPATADQTAKPFPPTIAKAYQSPGYVAPLATVGSGKVTILDLFGIVPDRNWGPDDANSTIASHSLQFHVPKKQQAERLSTTYTNPEVDLTAEVVPPVDSKPGAIFGLVVQADGKGNAAAIFVIDPVARRSAAFTEAGGKLTPIRSWSDAPKMEKWIPGYPHLNRIEAIAGKNAAVFLINGFAVTTIPMPATPVGSFTGFFAAGSDTDEGDFDISTAVMHFPTYEPTVTGQSAAAKACDYISGPDSKPPTYGTPGTVETGPQLPLGITSGQMLFTDDFKTLDPTWGQSGDYAFVKDGKFEFHAPAGHSISRTSGKYDLTDVDFSADLVAGPENKANAEAGLSFWADGSGDTQTVFEIDPIGGAFSVQSETDGKWTVVTDWRSTPLINSGTEATNRLEVIVTDYQQVLLLINGHQVGQIPMPATIPGELIGLYAAGSDNAPGDFGFANFAAKIPTDSPLPPGTVAAPKTAAGQAIFSDDFRSLDPAWSTTSDASPIKDGHLEISGPANDDTVVVNEKYEYGEADVSTGITEETGSPDDALGGLLFWSADANDYFLFAVNPVAGTFAAYHEDENKSTTLIDWTATKSLNLGIGKTNRVEVALRNDKAFLIINNHQVGELKAPAKPPGLLVGVYGSGGTKAAATFGFSSFSAIAPAGEGAPAGVTVEVLPVSTKTAPAPDLAPGTTIYSDDFKTLDPSWGPPDETVFSQNGRLEIRAAPGIETNAVNDKYTYPQADITVSAAAEDGTDSDGTNAGIIFWTSGSQDMTIFDVDLIDGGFAVYTHEGDTNKTTVAWRTTSLIDTGVGKINRIGVALRKDKALLMINGHMVGEVPKPANPPGDLIGLAAAGYKNGPGKVGYSDFSVTEPGDGDLPPGTSVAPTAAPGQTIFSDDFKTVDSSWGPSNASIYVANGRLELRSAGGGEVDAINNKYAYDDADIETSVVEEAGATHGPIGGILFWAADAARYTLFSVDPLSGKYAAFDQVGDKSDTLVAWTPSAAISKGINAPNRLRVSLSGGQATLFINDQQVGVFDKPAIIPGKLIGLYAGGDKQPGSYGFSNFVVKAPRGEAAGGAARVAEATAPPASQPPVASTSDGASAHAVAAANITASSSSVSTTPATTSAAEVTPKSQIETSQSPAKLQATQGSQHGTQSSPGSAHGVASSADAGPPQQQAAVAPLAPAEPDVSPPSSAAHPPAAAVTPPAPPAPSPQQEAARPSQMCPGQVVFEDDFQRMDRAWGRRDPNTFVTPNHAFGLAAIADHQNGRLNQMSRYADVDVCVNAFVSITNDPADAGGLLFWGDSNDDYYFLAITVDGRFGVFHFVDATTAATPIPLTATNALKTGKSVPNAIEVSLRGDQGTVIINGQIVANFSGQPPARGGYIGLQMAAQPRGSSAWGFYHLVVSSPVSPAEAAVAQSASEVTDGGSGAAQATIASGGSPSASSACGGQMLYQDNFETLDPSWGTADQSFYVKNGALMVAAAAAMTTSRSNTKARYGDFDVCLLTGSPLAPNAAGSAGLIFWASDARNFYVLAISNGGSYAVLRYTAGEVSAPVPWTSTNALKPGAGVWNTLEVKAVGTTATIAINGRTLTTVQGTPPAGGTLIALVAAAPKGNATSWAFGRLRIATPAAAAAATEGMSSQPPSTTNAGTAGQ